jgi:hypothetical protein
MLIRVATRGRRPSRTPEEYVDLGIEAILELLENEHAAVAPELEAKISEQPYGDRSIPIDAHHLTAARKVLRESSAIAEDTRVTRGGRAVTVITPADETGRSRRIEDAAKRKRLLHTRYLSLAMGSKTVPALLGRGGEAVLHATLLQAAPHGLRLLRPDGGEVSSLFGKPVVGGPLDSGAIVTTLDQLTLATSTHLALIEVKNVRSHLYPQALEVHQVLYKAAEVVAAHPHLSVVPVLVCRWPHFTLFTMAKQLGAFVVGTKQQPILPSKQLEPDLIAEIRDELGYRDLVITDQALPWMVDRFSRVLPTVAAASSERWRAVASTVLPYSKTLRTDLLEGRDRARLMETFRLNVSQVLSEPVLW